MSRKAIAVVDSGVGGLACLPAIRKIMPGEDIIYFGDTANMPYGTKSKEEILSLAGDFGDFLKGKGVKMIIFACGTISSTVIPFFYENYPEILIQGVIDPAVAAASRAGEDGDSVGVIATPRSIESGAYQEAFGKLKKKLNVFYKGCPRLSVLIEKGVTEGPEMEELLRSYLDELVYEDKIKILLLGCTHYPLAAECIKKLYPDLILVGPEQALARNAYSLLSIHEMENDDDEDGSLTIYVSKLTEGFVSMAKRLDLGEYTMEEVRLR